MSEEELKLKKYIWAYMLTAGYQTTGEWSIYGGHWDSIDSLYSMIPYRGSEERTKHQADLKALVKKHGVDWEATTIPEASTHSEFNGTFTDNSDVETLLGTLVLHGRDPMLIGVVGSETRFKDYALALAQLAADQKLVNDFFE